MPDRLLIYGATGYTGKLLARRAVERGLAPIIAGRHGQKVKALASALGAEARAFPLDDVAALSEGLRDVRCVLHAAGPYSATARPMLDACLERGAHYLDVTGDVSIFELAESLDARARAAGVMLLPGVGFDVVPSDCLAVHVASRVARPRRLRIGLGHAGGTATRGSLKSGVELLSQGLIVRRDGVLTRLSAGSLTHRFDFGRGSVACVAISMGDVVTAWHSTGIPNIEVYAGQVAEAEHRQTRSGLGAMMTAARVAGPLLAMRPVQSFLKRRIDRMPEGPTDEEREAGRAHVVVEVEAESGEIARSRLETPSGYQMTMLTGVEIAHRVQAGDTREGYQSPASAYGPDLVLGLESRREDLPPTPPP